MATETVSVVNHDIVGLVSRLDRFTYELSRSASSNGSQMSQYDQERLSTYIAAIRSYLAWVLGSPQLDLPETTPTIYIVKPLDAALDVENENIADLVRILNIARQEMVNSQSARQASGLIIHDERRFIAIIDKVQNFLEKYITASEPLDLPESSPAIPLTGPGRGGI